MVKNSRRVTSEAYPLLKIVVSTKRQHYESLAILDTGFTGHVAVPSSVFNGDLGLPDLRFTWKLADGRYAQSPVYYGTVQIVGLHTAPALITIMGDDFMLGRGVIDRFQVTFDHGRKVIVEL